MELALCHPSGTWNFEVVYGFLEDFCTPVFIHTCIYIYIYTCMHACQYTTHMTARHGQLFNILVSYIIWQVWDFSISVESSCSN